LIWISSVLYTFNGGAIILKAGDGDKFTSGESETSNSSGDEIANVNFLYADIVHVLQNTIDSCINSATDRRGGCVLERMFTKFSETTQYNGQYAIQRHSMSPISVPIESS